MQLRKSFTLAAILLFAGLASAQNLPKFSGLFFGDYYYVMAHDAANTVNPTSTFGSSGALQKDMQAFDYRRIYLTTDYDISQDFSARFRLEADPSASSLPSGVTVSSSDKVFPIDSASAKVVSNGKLSVMMKDAFIKWNNVTEGANITIGLQGTPEINMAEGIFGYRSLEKTVQDLHGISSSRDLGVSYNQKFSDAFTAGLLLGNNSSNSVPSNKYKASYLYLQFNPVKEFTILLNGQYNGVGVSSFNRTGDIIANYANSAFSLGAQYFMNGKNSAAGSPTVKQNGLSLNGWVGIIDNLRLVARYDNYTPNGTTKNTSYANSVQSLVLGALDWSVRKNVHFMPNFEYATYGWSKTSADLLARATFYITF